jgi:hypothetical protein
MRMHLKFAHTRGCVAVGAAVLLGSCGGSGVTNGGTGTCTYDPNGSGPPFPVSVGQTWQLQYTLSCNGSAPITYTQDGTVVDAEPVTVPAGTFNALKFLSTLA